MVGEFLKSYRKESKITLVELADTVSVSQP